MDNPWQGGLAGDGISPLQVDMGIKREWTLSNCYENLSSLFLCPTDDMCTIGWDPLLQTIFIEQRDGLYGLSVTGEDIFSMQPG